MDDYIYRVDTAKSLLAIRDRCFRARRWTDEQHSFPHQHLKQLAKSLSPTQRLFRICFFTSLSKAKKSREDDFKWFGNSHLLRCKKSMVISAGFTESWDDGFEIGDAYLFWSIEEVIEELTEFSSRSVGFDAFDVLQGESWFPLTDPFNSNAL
jgi:hypothetical protein